MTKIQPFGCDVRKASDEEKREFLRLLNEYEKSEDERREEFYYFGIKINKKTDGCFSVERANNSFKHIIPISEGISILKKALGEEKEELGTDLNSALAEAISLLKRTTEYEVMDSWKDDVKRLEKFIQPKQ